MRRIIFFITLATVVLACAKKTVPGSSLRGLAKLQLNGGAAISQPVSDEYSPYVLQMGDNYLMLVFGSNRSCGSCSGHNLFVSRSVSPYANDKVFPAFESPAILTISAAPLNFSNRINFAVAAAGNNLRIYLTNAGGVIQVTPNIPPNAPYDTTLLTIPNTAGQTATVVGVEFANTKLYARQNGTVYSFEPTVAAGPLTAMATGQTATSVASVDGAYTSRYDGFFSLIDGTITSMSLYGNGGNLVSVNTAVAKARLSARHVSVMNGGGFGGALMFVSGQEAGETSEDMYVVDGLTVYQMWQEINPKPPGAPDGGSTPVATATADPAFSPVAGHYGMPISVTMTSTTTGATICYTTDGVTDPACSATATCITSSTYSTPVSVTYTTANFRTRACKVGLTDSAVISATHVSDGTQPSTPGSPVADGTTSSQVQLSWTASTDAATPQPQLVYEICQTTINNGCNTFTATFTSSAGATSYNSNGLSASTTYYYRIRSRDLAGNTSGYTGQLTAATLTAPTVNTPTFNPVAGTYNATQNVTISTTTGSALLCYTTDGSTPACNATPTCTTGTTYSSAVNIAATATLRAIGCRNGYTNSSVTAGGYTIDTTAPVITGTAPITGATVSNTQVSYSVDETCASGNITWTWTGGTPDGGPHIRSLVGGELTSGSHNSITLTNNPTLVSGAVYSVSFNCTDAAGNAATTVTSTNVTHSASGGTTWTGRTMPSAADWRSVTYGNGVFVSVAAGTSTKAATSPDGITWTARTLPGAANEWYSVTYGNGVFVAITQGSTAAATSPDGITWTARTLPSAANWISVTYGNGVFVVVANNSTAAATSPNGITWTARTLPVSTPWRSVTYGNGMFAAVSDGPSTIAASSPDGVTWTQRTLPSSRQWYSVTYGNGVFAAIALSSNSAATSTDGITWAARTLPSSTTWCAVTYGNGIFAAVAQATTTAATSTDGITWTARTLPSSASWSSVAYGNGMFAAVSIFGTGAASSPNPDTTPPTMVSINPTDSANNISAGTSVQIAFNETINAGTISATTSATCTGTLQLSADNFSTCVPMSSTIPTPSGNDTIFTMTPTNLLAVSTTYKVRITNGVLDSSGNAMVLYTQGTGFTTRSTLPGESWTARTLPSSANWRSVAYGNGTFVAVATGSTNAATSTNGITWTARTLPSALSWYSVTYGNGTFVAVANGSNVAATSPDGITWTSRTLPSSTGWASVTYGNGVFVTTASGSNAAATSSDGITWTARTLPSSTAWISVTYGNGVFVVVAYNTTSAATSPDGITWTARTLPGSAAWISIAYGNGAFIAVPYGGGVALRSTDGITWTQPSLPTSSGWSSVAYGNGVFVAVAEGVTIGATSPDGISWTQRTIPNGFWLGVTYGNNIFVSVAQGPSTAAATSP